MELRGIIQSTMVHTHCAAGNGLALCMKDLNPTLVAQCRKGYPREFQEETTICENGYPTYRRQNNGQTFTIRLPNSGPNIQTIIDNRRVVPYSPYLCHRYKAHINVEVCGSVRAVKYIHKYIYKGGDRATAILDSEHDEIKRHLHGRYIGPTEAVWRLFEFDTHDEQPPVIHLALHLPGEQAIYFTEGEDPDQLRERMDTSITTLLAYFSYNLQNADGHSYIYHEFPEHFVYVRKIGWKRRSQGTSIGRMYSASPFMGERYYLRLLLTVVRGSTSFDNLRTIDAVLQPTFKAACIALRLLEDDGEWVALFTEGRLFMTGRALRHLFALALQHTTLTNPTTIWEQFAESFCHDIQHLISSGRITRPLGWEAIGDTLYLDYGLYLVQQDLNEYGKALSDFGLSDPILNWQYTVGATDNVVIQEEIGYNQEQEQERYAEMSEQLNLEQRDCFNAITAAVERYEGNVRQEE